MEENSPKNKMTLQEDKALRKIAIRIRFDPSCPSDTREWFIKQLEQHLGFRRVGNTMIWIREKRAEFHNITIQETCTI